MLLIVRDRCNSRQIRLVGDGIGIVRIVIPLYRHGQNLAGVDVHHNAAGTVSGLAAFRRLLHALLQEMLHHLVDRQHKTVAVLRFDKLFILERHVDASGIFRRHQFARSS